MKRLKLLEDGESFDIANIEEYEARVSNALQSSTREIQSILGDPKNWTLSVEKQGSPSVRPEPTPREHDTEDYDPQNPPQLDSTDRRDIRRNFPRGSSSRGIYQIFSRYLAEFGALIALENHVDLLHDTIEIEIPAKNKKDPPRIERVPRVQAYQVRAFISHLEFFGTSRTQIQDLMLNHTQNFLLWSTRDFSVDLKDSPLLKAVTDDGFWYLHREAMLEAAKNPPPSN